MSDISTSIRDRFAALKSQRDAWAGLWQEIAAYVFPRRNTGFGGTVEANSPASQVLFDNTAVHANMTLANGQLAWMSPLESGWYGFQPDQRAKKDDAAKLWMTEKTDVARHEMATSNAYTALHEFYLDRGAFGVAALYVEPGKKKALNFQHWPVGSFVIDEDAEGNVDTVIREFSLSARQAAQKFGAENLSPKLQAILGKKDENGKVNFLHAIYPREDADRDGVKMDGPNMAIASVYLEVETGHVCRESGYEEMPVMVSRYLEWGSCGGMYGWSPAFEALPEARQVNFLQKMMDALAEKMAFPPVLAPEELEGEIDANAHGVTYYSKDIAQTPPKEWMTAGRYDVGLDRVKERQAAINKAFHVDLFQMFAQIDKAMTAREVAERSSEKLIQFSPTFSRLVTELFNPMLQRVFGILLRAGKFGSLEEIPQSMITPISPDQGTLSIPRVEYASRLALALRALPSIGYQRTLERVGMVAQMKPDVLDNYDFDAAERETAMTDGTPSGFLVPVSLRDKTRKARAEAQAAQDQQMQQMAAAESLSKLGGISKDSALASMMPTA